MHVGLTLKGHPIIIIVILRAGHEHHRRTRRRPTHGLPLPHQDTRPGGIAQTHCHCTRLRNRFPHAPSLCSTRRADPLHNRPFVHGWAQTTAHVVLECIGRLTSHGQRVWSASCDSRHPVPARGRGARQCCA
jgi:hypothetical protein